MLTAKAKKRWNILVTNSLKIAGIGFFTNATTKSVGRDEFLMFASVATFIS